jgi:hypothetical protein
MKDMIELVETFDEASALDWTDLGHVDQKGGIRGVGRVWCKNNKFAVFNDDDNTHCSFIRFIPRHEAMERLFSWYKRLMK